MYGIAIINPTGARLFSDRTADTLEDARAVVETMKDQTNWSTDWEPMGYTLEPVHESDIRVNHLGERY